MELEIYNAFVFTKPDGAELEARLLRAMAEMQRWTLTAIFAAFGITVALIKFL